MMWHPHSMEESGTPHRALGNLVGSIRTLERHDIRYWALARDHMALSWDLTEHHGLQMAG